MDFNELALQTQIISQEVFEPSGITIFATTSIVNELFDFQGTHIDMSGLTIETSGRSAVYTWGENQSLYDELQRIISTNKGRSQFVERAIARLTKLNS